MFNNKFLSLSGFAYLYDIRRCQKGEQFITLNLIDESNESRSDDIWIECQLNMDDFPVMAKLEHLLAMEKTIILKFEAKYSGFQECYHGQSEHDPDNIVQLRGKLLKIHEHFVEKDSVPSWQGYGLESDMTSLRLGALT